MRAFFRVLPVFVLLLLISFPGSFAKSRSEISPSVHAIFTGLLPEGFHVFRGGEVPLSTGHRGHYLVMRNDAEKLMALVVDSTPADVKHTQPSPLETESLEALTSYLFREYVGLSNYEIRNERDRWIRVGRVHHPARWLRVRFNDGFEESDWVIRLTYPRQRQIILLLGKPATGSYHDCPAFRGDYFAMEQQAQALISKYGWDQEALPPKEPYRPAFHYLKNLLKSPYRKNCFDD